MISVVGVLFILLEVLLGDWFVVYTWPPLLAGLWAGFVLAQIVFRVFRLRERVLRMSRSSLSVGRYAMLFILPAVIILMRLVSFAWPSTWGAQWVIFGVAGGFLLPISQLIRQGLDGERRP